MVYEITNGYWTLNVVGLHCEMPFTNFPVLATLAERAYFYRKLTYNSAVYLLIFYSKHHSALIQQIEIEFANMMESLMMSHN